MQFGVNLPYDRALADPGALREFVQGVEGMGFDYLALPDHILAVDMSTRTRGTPSGERTGFRDPFVLMGYIAACTSRIVLATGVLVLTQRQTALVAKQAAEVDVLSGGRLRLGVGSGWNRWEFEQLGQSFEDRGRRIEEQIAVLRALWTEESVTFHGKWQDISEAGINPLPVQRPVPIWMGGSAEAVLRRVGRLADGWLPEERPGEELNRQVERVRGYVRDSGRDMSAFGIDGRLGLRSGTPEDWRAAVRSWEELGATGLMVSSAGAGCETVGDHLALLGRFQEVVG